MSYAKLILMIIMLNCSAQLVNAEQIEKKESLLNRVSVVPEIGNTSFHVTGIDSSFSSGSVVGVAARIKTSNDRLSWSVGAQYLQTGYKLRSEFGIFSLNLAEVSSDYLAIPVKSEYLLSHPMSEGTQYYLTGGLTPAYLLSAKFKNLINSEEEEFGIRSQMNGLDVLAGIGLGGRYQTEFGTFEFALEYHKGLMKVMKDIESKNEGLLAKAGYIIAL